MWIVSFLNNKLFIYFDLWKEFSLLFSFNKNVMSYGSYAELHQKTKAIMEELGLDIHIRKANIYIFFLFFFTNLEIQNLNGTVCSKKKMQHLWSPIPLLNTPCLFLQPKDMAKTINKTTKIRTYNKLWSNLVLNQTFTSWNG